MVAVIKPNQNLKDTFYYNENKLKSGAAVCLLAENYPREISGLNELEKLDMLRKMASLRPRLKVNSLHISLNFDPSESFSADQYKAIARDYMEAIGFGNQPYLVYQHLDAAHPHLHLVSTNIRADGKPISLHHLGIRASEPARKMIEQKYGLIRAEDQGNAGYQLQPIAVGKAEYGRTQTKRAIANVLQAVLESYRFASLSELNALLGLYHVRAERGSEHSRICQHRGLVYRLLDEAGIVAGVPVKASLYPWKPGLDYLENLFDKNRILKLPLRAVLKNTIDIALLKHPHCSLEKLSLALKQQGIDLVIHQNQQERIYGLSYVDHKNRCVFKGSELGKKYSAGGVLERLAGLEIQDGKSLHAKPDQVLQVREKNPKAVMPGAESHRLWPDAEPDAGKGAADFIDLLLRPEDSFQTNPFDLTRRRKKRKKKNHFTQE